MWILFAVGSAVFAALTSILIKTGVRGADSDAATALRTCVVLIFAWAMVFITGTQGTIPSIDTVSLIFLILSGIATGASWLCCYRALSLGDVSKVMPIDKSSTVLTMTVAMIFFGEFSWFNLIAIVLIAVGTLFMTGLSFGGKRSKSPAWLVWAVLSAVFASLTSVLGKIGIENVDPNVGTAIRTSVVLVMAWLVVVLRGKMPQLRKINRRSMLFIALSGIATGASWLCYWTALHSGALTVVVSVDKLSILLTIAFSWLFLRERITRRALTGLALIVIGTFVTLLPQFI